MSDCLIDVLREDVGDESPAYLHFTQAISGSHEVDDSTKRTPVDILYIEPARRDIGGSPDKLAPGGTGAITKALRKSGAFQEITAHQEVIYSDDAIVLLSFNGSEPLIGCAIDLSRSLSSGVRMTLHRHSSLRLKRDDKGRWSLAGEGINETRSITVFGKAGQILVSDTSVQALPTAYRPCIQMLGQFDLPKQSIVVSVLYSAHHNIGYMDLNHVPANVRPTRVRTVHRERRPSWRRVFAFVGALGLAGLIGTICWLGYNHSPVLPWRFPDFSAAAASPQRIQPHDVALPPETAQRGSPDGGSIEPTTIPDPGSAPPDDSPVILPQQSTGNTKQEWPRIVFVKSQPEDDHEAPWTSWNSATVDWKGTTPEDEVPVPLDIEIRVKFSGNVELKAFLQSDDQLQQTSESETGDLKTWHLCGACRYIKVELTVRQDGEPASPGADKTRVPDVVKAFRRQL